MGRLFNKQAPNACVPTVSETVTDISSNRIHKSNNPALTNDKLQADLCIPKQVNSIFPKRDIAAELDQLVQNIWVGSFLSLLSIAMALLENQLCYKNDFKQSLSTDSLRTMILLITLLHWYVVYKYYSYNTTIAEEFGEVYPKSNLKTGSVLALPGHKRGILIDLFSVSFSTPPIIYKYWKFEQIGTVATISLDDLVLILVLLRCIQLLKMFYLSSAMFSRRSTFVL